MTASLAQDSGRDVMIAGRNGGEFDSLSSFETMQRPVKFSILWEKERFVGVGFFGFVVLGLPLAQEVFLKFEKPGRCLWEFKELFAIIKSSSIAGRFSPKNEAEDIVL